LRALIAMAVLVVVGISAVNWKIQS